MAAARYFFHITRDEANNRYLIEIVVAAAALVPQAITDSEMLEVLDEGEGETDNVLNTRTRNLISDLYDAHMQDQASL